MKKVASIVAVVVFALCLFATQTEIGIDMAHAIVCNDCMPLLLEVNNVLLACNDCMPVLVDVENALACNDCMPINELFGPLA